MEINDHLLLVIREKTSLKVWSEIVSPTKSATLATPKKTSKLRNSSPTTLSIGKDEVYELPVFFCSPWSFLQPYFVTAWLSSHFSLSPSLSLWIVSMTILCFYLSLCLSLSWESKCYCKLKRELGKLGNHLYICILIYVCVYVSIGYL